MISCGARLAPFDIQEVRDVTAYDELQLDTLGDKKTALFLIMSDTDATFNFLISMIYTQLFNLLCEKADDVYGGRLPVHVRCLIDEMANIGQIPNLEKLVLYVGVEDYGFEGDIEIFRPLFSKERFPKLTYLGLVNSEEQDSIVEMFLESDILPQLETMDISAGTLKDEGAQLLLDNMDKIAHLKFINMRYNYLSKDMKKQLQNLPMKIDIAETEEADEYDGELWYYPMITE